MTAMDVAKTGDGAGAAAEAPEAPVDYSVEVIVHPLVLLSTVDHYNRVAKDTRKRVVGVLLGTSWRGRIDITNSFAGKCYLQHIIIPLAQQHDERFVSLSVRCYSTIRRRSEESFDLVFGSQLLGEHVLYV